MMAPVYDCSLVGPHISPDKSKVQMLFCFFHGSKNKIVGMR